MSLINEGVHSPGNMNSTNHDFLGTYWSGGNWDLSAIGERQMYLLGLAFKEDLLMSYNIELLEKEVYLFSIDTNKTINSALAFIQGIFPQTNKANPKKTPNF